MQAQNYTYQLLREVNNMGFIILLLFLAYAIYQIYEMLRDNSNKSGGRYYDYGDLKDLE